MFRSLVKGIRHFGFAVVLLFAIAAAAELVLRLQWPSPPDRVAGTLDETTESWLIPSPVVHHELPPLTTTATGFDHDLSTNSFGLRGPEPGDATAGNFVRVLLLGDESILGPHLPQPHTVSGRLQQFLTKATGQSVEVINAGVPGYCPLLSWLQYSHQLQQLRPDLVVLHFDMTDVADDSHYRRHLRENGRRQICFNDRLAERDRSRTADLSRNSALLRLLMNQTGFTTPEIQLSDRYAWTLSTHSDLRLQIQHAVSVLQQFQAAAREHGFQLLVSTSPVPWQLSTGDRFPELSRTLDETAAWPIKDDIPFRILSAVCRNEGIALCSSVQAFRQFQEPEKLFTSGTPQFSPHGATLYAREIASMLLRSPEFVALFSAPTGVARRTSVGGI